MKASLDSRLFKPQTHGVLIDLTEDSPLLTKTSFGGRESKLRMKPSPPSENISNPQPLTSPSSPEPRHSSVKVDRPRVSFAPSASFTFHSTFDTNELGFETSDRSKEKGKLSRCSTSLRLISSRQNISIPAINIVARSPMCRSLLRLNTYSRRQTKATQTQCQKF